MLAAGVPLGLRRLTGLSETVHRWQRPSAQCLSCSDCQSETHLANADRPRRRQAASAPNSRGQICGGHTSTRQHLGVQNGATCFISSSGKEERREKQRGRSRFSIFTTTDRFKLVRFRTRITCRSGSVVEPCATCFRAPETGPPRFGHKRQSGLDFDLLPLCQCAGDQGDLYSSDGLCVPVELQLERRRRLIDAR